MTRPDGRLRTISRAAILTDKSLSFRQDKKQVCIYAFDRLALDAFASTGAKTPLEAIEDIEILRFLELEWMYGWSHKGSHASIAVDVPEDVDRVQSCLDCSGEP